MKKCFVYAILFFCFISMTHSDAFAGDSTSNSEGKSTDSLWTGEWERINCSQHEGAGIKITKTTSKGFEFSLDAASGANVGLIEGTASFVKNLALYKDSETGCVLEFKMRDKCVTIKPSEECSALGGMGVYFNGTYCKGKQNKKQASFDFIRRGVFSNDAQVNAFKKLVGKSFDLFENSFQLVSKKEDMDNINATVSTGGVRGLFTIMEAIIMHCPNGMIYAAVIDGNTVKYFSNDPQYKDEIPTTIDNWSDRFGEKEVVFCSSANRIGPQGRYIDNNDGTVTDSKTNLMWMRCAIGQTWTGSACKGKAKEISWNEAIRYSIKFSDYDNWRLPTIDELATLVYCSNGNPDYFSNGKNANSETGDWGCYGKPGMDHVRPTIALEVFPNCLSSLFWSSSHDVVFPGPYGIFFWFWQRQ